MSTNQKGFALVSILKLILLLIETLSIGMVVPIFAAITDENFLNNIPILGVLVNNFFPENWLTDENKLIFSKMHIIIFCGIFVILVFIARTAALLLIYWRINGFISNLKLKLSDLFFKGYIDLPYVYHLKSDTSVLYNKLSKIYEVGESTENLFSIISELLIIFCLLVLFLKVFNN